MVYEGAVQTKEVKEKLAQMVIFFEVSDYDTVPKDGRTSRHIKLSFKHPESSSKSRIMKLFLKDGRKFWHTKLSVQYLIVSFSKHRCS